MRARKKGGHKLFPYHAAHTYTYTRWTLICMSIILLCVHSSVHALKLESGNSLIIRI